MNKMKTIKVLVVDDSFFMRKLLRELLEQEKDIEVVGDAKNGVEAVGEAIRLKPDVITMDYNMPKMTGAEAIVEILAQVSAPLLPRIVMLSAYTTEGAEATLECFRAGAVDAIEKPSGELSLDIETIHADIVKKVRSASRAKVFVSGVMTQKKRRVRPGKRSGGVNSDIVVIGSSTGGPPVVEDIVVGLPKNFSVPVVVVQHMPPFFTRVFASRLDRMTAATVKEVMEGEVLRAGTVYIAPGDYHVVFKKTTDNLYTIHLNQDPPVHGLRPSIDVSMESAAKIFGKKTVGVELTGMGEDGHKGMEIIKSVGGKTIVQDPKTAVIASMPQGVIDQGNADVVCSREKILATLLSLS